MNHAHTNSPLHSPLIPIVPSKRCRFLSIQLPYSFIKRMEECNCIFGQQQLDNIHTTINLIQNRNKLEKMDSLKKAHIQKCIHWCIQYKMPIEEHQPVR